MSYGIRVEVWGDYALFSRPELKVERVSYDVITPSAARGILEAVLWKPAIRYVIDKIHILNPIKFTNIRRNEVKSKANVGSILAAIKNPEKIGSLYLDANSSDMVAQRASMILKDVHYIVDFHFEITEKAGESDSEEKFYAMICRRLRNGQCYHTPYFGCREFPVHFKLFEEKNLPPLINTGEKDLGLMLYDMDYSDTKNITPTFFRAVINDGTMDLQDCEVFR